MPIKPHPSRPGYWQITVRHGAKGSVYPHAECISFQGTEVQAQEFERGLKQNASENGQ